MTFLEYVAERLMGPPDRRSATDGESYWCCPFHNDTSPSFHTMPHKPEFRDRWKCFGCGMRGDEADLMRELLPGEDWNRRRARLMQWRVDYEREHEVEVAPPKPGCVLLRGGGSLMQRPKDHPLAVAAAWANLSDAEREGLASMQGKLGDVTLDAVAAYHRHFKEWMARTDAEHLAECQDPAHCDDAPCRRARGLPPLTAEEIRAGTYRVDGHTPRRA